MVPKIFTYMKASLVNIARMFGYKVLKVGPYSVFNMENFLYRHLTVHKDFIFLQVGANDGIMGDPLYEFNLANKDVVSGFVLEPLPDIYNRLVKNYEGCPGIKPFNIAIHSSESEMFLYRVKQDRIKELSSKASGIASFDDKHWEKTTLVPDICFMEKVKVNCVSINEFIRTNKIDRLDLLLLDTEGYDYDILLSLDFSCLKPKIIHFEHGLRNSVMSTGKFMQLCRYLNSKGYQIIAESYDATAYILDPDDLFF